MVSKVYEVSNKKMEIFFTKLFTGLGLFRRIRKPLMRPIDFGHPPRCETPVHLSLPEMPIPSSSVAFFGSRLQESIQFVELLNKANASQAIIGLD